MLSAFLLPCFICSERVRYIYYTELSERKRRLVMRILIIGGTRFIGPYLIKNLSEAGYEVHIFHRGKTQTELPSGVQEILGHRYRLITYVSTLLDPKPDLLL